MKVLKTTRMKLVTVQNYNLHYILGHCQIDSPHFNAPMQKLSFEAHNAVPRHYDDFVVCPPKTPNVFIILIVQKYLLIRSISICLGSVNLLPGHHFLFIFPSSQPCHKVCSFKVAASFRLKQE